MSVRPITLEQIGLTAVSFEALLGQAEALGYDEIGAGDNAVVMAHPDHPDIAVRLSPEPDNFLVYATLCHTDLAGSPYRKMLPLVHDVRFLRHQGTACVVERLLPLDGYFEEIDDIGREFPDQAAAFYALCGEILQKAELRGLDLTCWDLGSGNASFNVMQRRDGTLVIADPLGGACDAAGQHFLANARDLPNIWPEFQVSPTRLIDGPADGGIPTHC